MAQLDIFATFTPTAQTVTASGTNLSTDWIDLLQNNQVRDIGAGADLYLQTTVTTAFTAITNASMVRFELHAYPRTTLTDAALVIDTTADTIAIPNTAPGGSPANNVLPVGTPVFLTVLATSTGISTNIVYYVTQPNAAAGTIKLALSLANALAGTAIDITGSNGTCTLQYVPVVLASTGDLTRGLLLPGVREYALTRPIVGSTLLTGGSYARPIPRYLFGATVNAAAAAGGAVLQHLVLAAQDGQRYYRSGFVVQG